MSYIGRQFPNMTLKATDAQGQTSEINVFEKAAKNKNKVLLFWWPKDYSPLCPTELHAFQEALPEFEKRNTVIIGASCDTLEVHNAWLNTEKNNGGVKGITYPIISDANRNLSSVLDILDIKDVVLDEDSGVDLVEGENVAYRATYLIDETGHVFHEGINHMPLARRVGDYLRMIDAFGMLQQHGELCPANWENA